MEMIYENKLLPALIQVLKQSGELLVQDDFPLTRYAEAKNNNKN